VNSKAKDRDVFIVSRANRDWGVHFQLRHDRETANADAKAWKRQGFRRVRVHKVTINA